MSIISIIVILWFTISFYKLLEEDGSLRDKFNSLPIFYVLGIAISFAILISFLLTFTLLP